MSGGRYQGVDLDLLADYVGGALAGTPDEAAVARLIANDPDWAAAHAALAPAVEQVRRSLTTWGADEAMPSDVASRLSEALASAGVSRTSGEATRPMVRVPSQSRGGRAGGTALDVGRRPPSHARRWSRWARPAAAAAAVAAFAGFMLTQTTGGPSDDSAQSIGGVQPETLVAPGGLEVGPRAERVVASGTDYTRAGLAEAVAALAGTQPDNRVLSSPPPAASVPAVAGLTRLSDGRLLAACLDAVAAEHGRGPVTVELVDYASFEGTPAVVVSLVDQGGERWAWVAGPRCGSDDADTRYRTRVG